MTFYTCFRGSEITISLDSLDILKTRCKPNDITDHLSSKPGNYCGLNSSSINRSSPPLSIPNKLPVVGKMEQDFHNGAQKTPKNHKFTFTAYMEVSL